GARGNESSGSGGSSRDGKGNKGAGSRRPGALLLTLIILGVLGALFVLFSMVYTDVLWFNQIGYQRVFWSEYSTKAILFIVAGAALGVITWRPADLAAKYRPRRHGAH